MINFIYFLLSIGVAFASCVNIISYLYLIKTVDIVDALDRGAKGSLLILQSAQDEIPSFLRLHLKCSDVQSRAQLTLFSALHRLSDGRFEDRASYSHGNMLAQAADQRLRCNPLDGNAWLSKVISLDGSHVKPSNPGVLIAKSCDLAPAEKWIIDYRVPVIRYIYEMDRGINVKCFHSDLSILMKYYSPLSISKFYVESSLSFRQILRREWADLGLTRKILIARTIDQAGYVLDRSFWNDHVVRNKM